MNDRTKRLYVVVLLLWVILLTVAVIVAHSRATPQGEEAAVGDTSQPRAEMALMLPGAGLALSGRGFPAPTSPVRQA